jgi:hypothetical protein
VSIDFGLRKSANFRFNSVRRRVFAALSVASLVQANVPAGKLESACDLRLYDLGHRFSRGGGAKMGRLLKKVRLSPSQLLGRLSS